MKIDLNSNRSYASKIEIFGGVLFYARRNQIN